MRTTALLMMISLVGCSQVLGIQDPSPGGRIDGGVDAPDAPTGDHLMFSIGDFKVAQQQQVRFHVLLVHIDGRMDDVSTTATLMSDSSPLATIGPTSNGAATVRSGLLAGGATIRATLGGAAPATVRVTVTTIPCHPVINELTTGTSVGGSGDEWAEIYNPCTTTVDVSTWTLNYRAKTTVAGMPDSSLLISLAGSMAPGELRLYAGVSYAGTPAPLARWGGGAGGILAQTDGAVGLRSGPSDTTGTGGGALVDAIAYGAGVTAGHPFIETNPTQALANGLSASRLPFDGRDDGADDAHDGDGALNFKVISTPTPGALNAR